MPKDRLEMGWWRSPDGDVMGNDAATKMWEGFDHVGRAYYEAFGRPPTVDELRVSFEFCIKPLERGEFVYDPVLGRWKRPDPPKE